MKLCRIGPAGSEVPGILDAEGVPRSLEGIIRDVDATSIAAGFEALRGLDRSRLPRLKSGRIGACVAKPGKIVCVGLNYAEHVRESNLPTPSEPVLFMKACLATGANDDIAIPPEAEKADWEVELAVVIGRHAYRVSEADALSYVAGYCIMDDVSERAYQHERGGQWMKGKSLPGFAPIGPWLVTSDEVRNPGELPLSTKVNGIRYQNSSTADLIFSVPVLISYISNFLELNPGDIISTGTPSGVGAGLTPPKFLRPGDALEMAVEGLGVQRHKFVEYR